MKISKLIDELIKFQEKHGDIEVYVETIENGLISNVEALVRVKNADGMNTEVGCLIDY